MSPMLCTQGVWTGPRSAAVALAAVVSVGAMPAGGPAEPVPRFAAKEMQTQSTRVVRWRYLLHLPDGYEKESRRWPLLLFLHGGMGRGDDFARMGWYPFIRTVKEGEPVPFVVVAPQCPEGGNWLDAEALTLLLDSVLKTYRIDPERVYLAGYSMGGEGAWFLAYERPDRFAAVAPMSGYGNPLWADHFRGLPVWAFHGGKDALIPASNSEAMVEAIRRNGGDGRLSIDPERGHAPPTREEEAALLRWFLEHRRSPRPGPE
jgi:predicted peptidase